MVERELKILLTAEEFTGLQMTVCKYAKPKIQTNYYFDTETLSMNRKGVTCRIRFKDGVYKATVKSHNSDTSISTEYDLGKSIEFNPNIFGVLGFCCYGNLSTERFTIFKNDELDMVLDRNNYLGKTDYELEIEYAENCYDKAMNELYNIADILYPNQCIKNKECFVMRTKKAKFKSDRFFETFLKK